MPANNSASQTRVALESRAWDLRQRGLTQRTIAASLGVNQATVCRLLARIEQRELARMAETVEREKMLQTAILEHVIDESFQAWERSKRPKKRAVERSTAGVGKGQTIEATEREDDPVYIDRVMQALLHIRRIWGLDATTTTTTTESGTTYAQVVRNVKANAIRFDAQALPSPES